MSDLVERLRAGTNFYAESSLWYDRNLASAVDEAADEIERLRAQVEELREVVEGAAAVEEFGTTVQARERLGKMARKALAALEGKP